MTIVPRNGRDYTSLDQVRADFYAGRDFTVADMSSRWDTKPVNVQDLKAFGVMSVNVRYAGLRRIATLPTTE